MGCFGSQRHLLYNFFSIFFQPYSTGTLFQHEQLVFGGMGREEDVLWLFVLGQYRALLGFPGGTSSKEPSRKYRRLKRCGFNPWVGKIPWSRKWQSTPVFLPGESPWTEDPGRLQSIGSHRVRHD